MALKVKEVEKNVKILINRDCGNGKMVVPLQPNLKRLYS